MMAGMFGGDNCVLSKSKGPSRCVCNDMFRHVLEHQSKFKISSICRINSPPKYDGNFECAVARPENRWFFPVYIAFFCHIYPVITSFGEKF